MEKIYLVELEKLERLADEIPNTRMMSLAKVTVLILLNMRYERIMLDRHLPSHPYLLVAELAREAYRFLSGWREISFIEPPSRPVLSRQELPLEQHHRDLFQQLWVRFSPQEYEKRIDRYVHRLRINGLGRQRLTGLRCIDIGCGHGSFTHALLREGARYAYGIDFGEESIGYALSARDRLGIEPQQLEFKVESAYQIGKPDGTFDFAIQNGVFHHLQDEEAALREVRRVLRPGGWFWYYTDGSGGIGYDLWDTSRTILRDVPLSLTLSFLEYLQIETGKRYHLGDGLHAIYRRTTWDELTQHLERAGFGNFRRLTGGFDTDGDLEAIQKDPYGREKFGEGDLRVLAQLLNQ